jgi:hypothetical protein
MLKVALLASALLLAVSAATGANGVTDPMVALAAEAACHPGQSFDLGCAVRVADADGDGAISAIELAALAVPLAPVASIVDWTPLHPAHGTGLDFKDAATEPGSVLPMSTETDGPQRLLIPTMLALAALVVLLRRRPT